MSRAQPVTTRKRVNEGKCPRCSQPVLGGLASGMEWTVDPQALDPLGELAAVLDGRWTLTLYVVAEELHLRSHRAIRSRPAGTQPRQTVHAEHRCPPREGTPTP